MGHLVHLFRTFALGFKARVDPLASMFLHLHTMDSLDSPLVRRFYSSSQQAWQLNHFDPHTFSSIGGTQQTGTRTDLANSARLDLAYYLTDRHCRVQLPEFIHVVHEAVSLLATCLSPQ